MSSIGYDTLSTLTPQQQAIADQLQGRVGKAGSPPGLDPAATTKYINQSVATPLLRQYDYTIMPRLKDAYAAVGGLFSSRRAFAQQSALEDLQNTIGAELGKAQLSNQQLAANMALQYNQLGAGLTGQSHMAIQPYKQNAFNSYQNNGGMDLSLLGRPFAGQGGQKPSMQAQPLGLASFGSYLDGLGNDDQSDLYGQYDDSQSFG